MRDMIEVFREMGALVGRLADLRVEARGMLEERSKKARKGGKSKSPKKAAAARANGKKGGRPKAPKERTK